MGELHVQVLVDPLTRQTYRGSSSSSLSDVNGVLLCCNVACFTCANDRHLQPIELTSGMNETEEGREASRLPVDITMLSSLLWVWSIRLRVDGGGLDVRGKVPTFSRSGCASVVVARTPDGGGRWSYVT
jgi:hypothetical protein